MLKDSSLNLQGVLETLPVAHSQPPTVKKVAKVSRKSQLRLELEHFGKVISHPAFKQDPVSAITTHIVNKHEIFKSTNK